MKELKLNDVFQSEDYDMYRTYASENNYQIVEVDPIIANDIIRRFQVITNTPHVLGYKELRRQEYPSVLEQLDMIYWDKTNGTNNWVEMIKSIKEKYPKK